MSRLPTILMAGAMCALAAWPAAAQQVPSVELGQVLVTRQSLEDLATRLEQSAESHNFSSSVRANFRAQAVLVRTRLREGDFQVGDRIVLTVDAETALSRPYVVLSGRQIALPGIGNLDMAGVLRSELTDHIRTFLTQYLRDPKVRAQALIRLEIIGGVAHQGWVTAPVDVPLDSVLGIAGGLAANAQVDKIHIERDQEELYAGRELGRLISNGGTPDGMSLQQGDRIIIPESVPRTAEQTIRSVQYLLQVPVSLYALIKLLGF